MAQVIEVDDDRVVWKFRLEYRCKTMEPPWWQRITEPNPRPCPVIESKEPSQEWKVTSNGPRTTFISAQEKEQMDRGPETEDGIADRLERTKTCHLCHGISTRPYSLVSICLNEECVGWNRISFQISESTLSSHLDENFGSFSSENNISAFQKDIMPGIDRERITPESLNMALRPPEPKDIDSVTRSQAATSGREYWTGWVCHGCGCASEREKWDCFSCQGCKVSRSSLS